MSKKPTIADYKQRAELAETKLEAVMELLKADVERSDIHVRDATLIAEKKRDSLSYAERAIRNVRLPVTKDD